MRALEVTAFGDASNVRVVEVDRPTPQAHEALIKIEAAGINYADIMMRRGLYLGGPKPPYRPGFEAAGTIEEVGADVVHLSKGDRVIAMSKANMFAEYACAPVAGVIPLPDEIPFPNGAAFPVNFLTAHYGLHACGKLRVGESTLIHAAAGGVGVAAVQLAKLAGATVFATASSPEKLAVAAELGADHVINYQTEDFEAIVKEKTAGKGVDVILESVGGQVFEKSQRVLAEMGRLVVIGVASAEAGAVNVLDLLFRNKSVIGFHLGNMRTQPELHKKVIGELLAYWKAGRVRTIVGKTFPLEQCPEAMEWISTRHSIGKAVLLPHG